MAPDAESVRDASEGRVARRAQRTRRVLAAATLLVLATATTQAQTTTAARGAATKGPTSAGSDAAGGSGVAPGVIILDDALRGSTVFSSVIVFNNDGKDRVYELRASGDTAAWVTLGRPSAPSTSVTVVAGNRQVVPVEVAVPPDAANGEHTGAIEVIPKGTGVNIAFQVGVRVHVTGTQRAVASLRGIRLSDPVEVGQPLTITSQIENTGNVALRSYVDVVVTRKSLPVDTLTSKDAMELVPPDSSVNIVVTWPNDDTLPGDYEVAVHGHAGELDLGTKVAKLRIAPPGSLRRAGTLDRFRLLGKPVAGGPLRLQGTFSNRSETAVFATLTVSTYDGDRLLSRDTSPRTYVKPATAIPLEAVFDDAPEADLLVVGKVDFDGFSTKERELRVDLAGDSGSALGLIGGGAAAAAALVLLALWVRRRGQPLRPTRPPTGRDAVVRRRAPGGREESELAMWQAGDVEAADQPRQSTGRGQT